jgi:hypothetical protein
MPEAVPVQGWDAALADAESRNRPDLVGLSWREGTSQTSARMTIVTHLVTYGVVGRRERKVGPPIHREGGVVCFYRRRVYDSIMGDVPKWVVEIRVGSGALSGILVLGEEELRERASASSFAWSPSPAAHGMATGRPGETARVSLRPDSQESVLDQLCEFRERLSDNSTNLVGLAWTTSGGDRVEVLRDELLDDHGSFYTKQRRNWVVAVTDGQGRAREVTTHSMTDAVARLTKTVKRAGEGGAECVLLLPPAVDEAEAIATRVQKRYAACASRLQLQGTEGGEPWIEPDLAAAGLDPGGVATDVRWLGIVDLRLGAAFARAAVPLTTGRLEIDTMTINRAPDVVRPQIEAILRAVTLAGRTLDHQDLSRLGLLLRRGLGV